MIACTFLTCPAARGRIAARRRPISAPARAPPSAGACVMPDLPSGTVTFLFTDIAGSTRLLQQHGQRYGSLLTAYRALLRSLFQTHRGQEVDTQGDSFFVAFGRAVDAVAAAVAIQR